MPGDKPWCGRLLANDANDILAVEIARHPQEGLFAVVVVFFPVLEEPVVAANRATRQLGQDGPASERPGALAHVCFRVVAYPHTEELEEFAAPVLIHGRG